MENDFGIKIILRNQKKIPDQSKAELRKLFGEELKLTKLIECPII